LDDDLLKVFSRAFAFQGTAAFFVLKNAGFDAGGAFSFLAASALDFGGSSLLTFSHSIIQRLQETFASELAVLELGARILDGDEDAGGQMAQNYFGGGFVDVLSARSRRAFEGFFEFRLVQ
jgi:hypothetical protein